MILITSMTSRAKYNQYLPSISDDGQDCCQDGRGGLTETVPVESQARYVFWAPIQAILDQSRWAKETLLFLRPPPLPPRSNEVVSSHRVRRILDHAFVSSIASVATKKSLFGLFTWLDRPSRYSIFNVEYPLRTH